VLRLHPKNTRDEFAAYLGEFDEVSAGGDPLALIHSADAVVGMTSMLLLEAALLGRPTLAIVPRAVERDWLPSIRAGVTRCATTRAEVAAELARVMEMGGDASPAGEPDWVPLGSMRRIVGFVRERLEEDA
jgi:hypothetical protein